MWNTLTEARDMRYYCLSFVASKRMLMKVGFGITDFKFVNQVVVDDFAELLIPQEAHRI